MPDYFPLVAGAVREYAAENSSGTGGFKVEVLDVETKGGVTTARCRRTLNLPGNPGESPLTRRRTPGVHEGDPSNPVAPAQWSPPRRFGSRRSTRRSRPRPEVHRCLRVAYLIAEGDGGSGERLYAPGVGLVKAVDNDEGEPLSFSLVKKTP
jgi:hypothetical protein